MVTSISDKLRCALGRKVSAYVEQRSSSGNFKTCQEIYGVKPQAHIDLSCDTLFSGVQQACFWSSAHLFLCAGRSQ